MRRTAWRRWEAPTDRSNEQAIEERPMAMQRLANPPNYSGGASGVPIEKVVPLEHEGYRRLVAAMPCKHCGLWGYSQAAHPNTDKGQGTKTDDRLCFALCTVHPVGTDYVQGCHERFDQGALYTKAARREIEPAWGADTRASIQAAGLWPKDLPMWTEPA